MSQLSLIGEKVGNYVIKSLLGRGGMASVFLAEHPRIGRQVAVKVLAPHLTLQPEMPTRFEREARAAARLRHPNIIEIIDFGNLDDGSPYYTMELLVGRELRQLAREKKRWTAWEALPYLKQICAALQVAHEARMVHRDLKPENIFVLDEEPMRLKILDFGIAKLLESDDALQTATGTLLGSPYFAAPEQAAGQVDAVCPQSDIYSLGVILYWMLCGKPPFMGKAQGMLIAQHIKEEPPPLLTRNPAVPVDVAALVHGCLQKDPRERPATAREVARRFEKLLTQQDRDGLVEELQEASPGESAEDGLPGEALSHSLVAFLGADDQPVVDDLEDESPEEAAPRLEPRTPAPVPTGAPEPAPAETPPTDHEPAVPTPPPRVPAAAPSTTPASRLDLPPPLHAGELSAGETDVDHRPTEAAVPLLGDAPGADVDQPTIRDLPLLGDVGYLDDRPTEAAVTGDRLGAHRGTPGGREHTKPPPYGRGPVEHVDTTVLGLMGDEAERADLLGASAADEDDRPTERALPLLGQPEPDTGEADDGAFTTSVLGLIGDPTERSRVLGEAEEADEVDEAAITTVVKLLGDDPER